MLIRRPHRVLFLVRDRQSGGQLLGELSLQYLLSDLETCFKMAWREIWQSLDLKENGFGIEAEATGKF